MMQRFRIGLTVVGLTAALAGCGDTASGPATNTPPTSTVAVPTGTVATTDASDSSVIGVAYSGGAITGGGRREVGVGQSVTLQVTSDVADEVHLHGYDKKVAVESGNPAKLTFTADIPGIFEVELESQGVQLLELVVK